MSASAFSAPATEKRQTLLLVDDEAAILTALKRELFGSPYRVLTASNGRDALALLTEHEVQVIVSDYRMPEMTGVEFLAEAHRIAPDGIRMVMSGYADINAVIDAINRGFIYKFISKPWDRAALRQLIDEAFAQHARLLAGAQFERIYTHTGEGIFVIGKDGRFTSANPAFCTLSGYAASELLGQSAALLHPAPTSTESPSLLAAIDAAQQHGQWQGEILCRHRDGRTITTLTNIAALCDSNGQLSQIVGLCSDISEQKAVEAELAQYRQQLEKMVADRTAALSIAKEAAEAANRAKSAFLAKMGHELRTPLNAIMGISEQLMHQTVAAEQRHQLVKVLHASRQLLGSINSILDLSQLEGEKLTLTTVDCTLDDIFSDVLATLTPAAASKGLTLTVDMAGELRRQLLHCDPMRFGQILFNLIGNAIKFTHQGGVVVRVAAGQQTARQRLLRVEIQDTGIGMSRDEISRLFSAFEQLDNSLARKHGGIGLGLLISRRLARLMGGDIGVSSLPGQGSTFWVTLNVGVSTASPTSASDVSPQAQTTIRPADSKETSFPETPSVLIDPQTQATMLAEIEHLLAEDNVAAQARYRQASAWLNPLLGERAPAFILALDNFDFESALQQLRTLRDN